MHRHEGAGDSRDLPADEAHDQHVRAGRRLRQREHLREFGVGHPVLDVDGALMHLGNDRIGAADRQQRKHEELQRELDQQRIDQRQPPPGDPDRRRREHARSPRAAECRSSAIATNVVAAITIGTGAAPMGRAILSATDSMSPDAAADTPVQAPRTASMWANCANSIASSKTMTSGISMSPHVAASGADRPWKRRPMMTEMLTMFGPGRNCDERQRFGEFRLGQPAVSLDQHPVRKRQDAAEPRYADLEESRGTARRSQPAARPWMRLRSCRSLIHGVARSPRAGRMRW